MGDVVGAPMPNSYWVMPGWLAAGEYPGALLPGEAASKARMLLGAGIDHFIDLTQERDGLEPYEHEVIGAAEALGRPVRRESHPIRDNSVPRSRAEMAAILDAIDDALDQGRTVYVHCWGGVGRTGTVVGCWLVRHGCTGDEALERIAELWSGVEKNWRQRKSPQTREQWDFVQQWAEPRQDSPPSASP